MRSRAVFLIALAAIALVAGGGAASATATGTGSVSGAYALSFTGHNNPPVGGELVAAGAIVFNGAGGITGQYSQSCAPFSGGCPQPTASATFTGTYVLRANGTATLDFCVNNLTELQWEGAFSLFFRNFRFVEVQQTSPCVSGGGGQGTPSWVLAGTAEKL